MESPQWNQFVSQFQTLQLVDDFSSRLRSCSLTLAMEILLFKKEMYTSGFSSIFQPAMLIGRVYRFFFQWNLAIELDSLDIHVLNQTTNHGFTAPEKCGGFLREIMDFPFGKA